MCMLCSSCVKEATTICPTYYDASATESGLFIVQARIVREANRLQLPINVHCTDIMLDILVELNRHGNEQSSR